MRMAVHVGDPHLPSHLDNSQFLVHHQGTIQSGSMGLIRGGSSHSPPTHIGAIRSNTLALTCSISHVVLHRESTSLLIFENILNTSALNAFHFIPLAAMFSWVFRGPWASSLSFCTKSCPWVSNLHHLFLLNSWDLLLLFCRRNLQGFFGHPYSPSDIMIMTTNSIHHLCLFFQNSMSPAHERIQERSVNDSTRRQQLSLLQEALVCDLLQQSSPHALAQWTLPSLRPSLWVMTTLPSDTVC